MKNAILTLVMILGFSLISIGQEISDTTMIRAFYKGIYNKNVTAKELVDKYVIYNDSLGYKNAIGSIMYYRKPNESKDGYFSLLKKDIIADDFSIRHFSSFSDIDKAKFTYLNNDQRSNIYKLDVKNAFPSYIWVKDHKILAFFGYVKVGDDNHAFLFY